MFFHQHRPSILLTTAVAIVVAPQGTAQAATEVGTPIFDTERGAVLIPYEGGFPAYTIERQAEEPQIIVEIDASPSSLYMPPAETTENAALSSFQIKRKG